MRARTLSPGRLGGTWWRRGPLITPDSNTVAHVVFRNGVISDTRGNSWSMSGTVPQNSAAGSVPPSGGTFTDANYYSLGAGNDVLDFAGNFSGCIIFSLTSTPAAVPVAFSNGEFGVNGYYVYLGGSASPFSGIVFRSPADNVISETATGFTAGIPQIACFGRSGTTGYFKANLRTLITGATGAITTGTTSPAYLGRYVGINNSFSLAGGKIYEAWFSSSTPSDALFTSLVTQAFSRMRRPPP